MRQLAEGLLSDESGKDSEDACQCRRQHEAEQEGEASFEAAVPRCTAVRHGGHQQEHRHDQDSRAFHRHRHRHRQATQTRAELAPLHQQCGKGQQREEERRNFGQRRAPERKRERIERENDDAEDQGEERGAAAQQEQGAEQNPRRRDGAPEPCRPEPDPGKLEHDIGDGLKACAQHQVQPGNIVQPRIAEQGEASCRLDPAAFILHVEDPALEFRIGVEIDESREARQCYDDPEQRGSGRRAHARTGPCRRVRRSATAVRVRSRRVFERVSERHVRHPCDVGRRSQRTRCCRGSRTGERRRRERRTRRRAWR